jgi:hypothetical protein
MSDREFNEINLRIMLENTIGYSRDIVEERWIIRTKHQRRKWEISVEPDFDEKLLVVVTAYPVYGDYLL